MLPQPKDTERNSSPTRKVASAVAYAVTSILTMVIIKSIFTTYGFRSYLFIAALQQSTSLVLVVVFSPHASSLFSNPLRCGVFRSFFPVTIASFVSIFPLAVAFFVNTLAGLGATQRLNLPLFVLLRRLSLWMILLLEKWWMRRQHCKCVNFSVALMVMGAGVAALGDPSAADPEGIMFILGNDVLTAFQAVALRKRLEEQSSSVGAAGLMFLLNALALPLTIAAMCASEGPRAFLYLKFESVASSPVEERQARTVDGPSGKREDWSTGNVEGATDFSTFPPQLILLLALAGVMGYFLNAAYFQCTKLNSPLMTAAVGAAKNTVSTVVGMGFRDFRPSWGVGLGIALSLGGNLLYNFSEWSRTMKMEEERRGKGKTGLAVV